MGSGALLNKPCPCGSGKKFKKCCKGKGGNFEGTIQHVFNFGSSDPFVARMMLQVFDMRDFVFKLEEIDAFGKAYNPFLQNMTETKIVKDRCVDLIKNHTEGILSGKLARMRGATREVDECIDTDLNIWFKDFFIRGNMASKNLIRFAEFFGYDISFMFGDSKKFEKGKKKFLEKHKKGVDGYFIDMIEDHRGKWYESFASFRVKIEHKGFCLPDIKYRILNGKIEPVIVRFGSLSLEQYLNMLWGNLFYFCEEVIMLLFVSKLPKNCSIMNIPEKNRDPQKPIRFKITVGMPDDARKVEYKDTVEWKEV
jgi:hypothetical protein